MAWGMMGQKEDTTRHKINKEDKSDELFFLFDFLTRNRNERNKKRQKFPETRSSTDNSGKQN